MSRSLSHLMALEAEAIHILREATAEAQNPVMLFSAGKDSVVMASLAVRAFYPSPPPFPLLHIDSTWEFQSLLEFRDAFARDNGFKLIVASNEPGRAEGLNPFDHGDRYTTAMRTEPLKTALRDGGYDIVFGGARRDEEEHQRQVSIDETGGPDDRADEDEEQQSDEGRDDGDTEDQGPRAVHDQSLQRTCHRARDQIGQSPEAEGRRHGEVQQQAGDESDDSTAPRAGDHPDGDRQGEERIDHDVIDAELLEQEPLENRDGGEHHCVSQGRCHRDHRTGFHRTTSA